VGTSFSGVITKQEIEAKSQEFDIHISNVEGDYVFGWILAGIYSGNPLGDFLVLKGGNCFRKAYFANTRFSNDLDFSTSSALDSAFLAAQLNAICDFVQENAGVVFEKSRNKVEEKSNSDNERKIYEARLYSQDFYGNLRRIDIYLWQDHHTAIVSDKVPNVDSQIRASSDRRYRSFLIGLSDRRETAARKRGGADFHRADYDGSHPCRGIRQDCEESFDTRKSEV